jgi:hypothetical protein
VKNMVADLDEKLSDSGPRDVEGASPVGSSPAGSDQEEEASPDPGRRNLFLAGIQEVRRTGEGEIGPFDAEMVQMCLFFHRPR